MLWGGQPRGAVGEHSISGGPALPPCSGMLSGQPLLNAPALRALSFCDQPLLGTLPHVWACSWNLPQAPSCSGLAPRPHASSCLSWAGAVFPVLHWHRALGTPTPCSPCGECSGFPGPSGAATEDVLSALSRQTTEHTSHSLSSPQFPIRRAHACVPLALSSPSLSLWLEQHSCVLEQMPSWVLSHDLCADGRKPSQPRDTARQGWTGPRAEPTGTCPSPRPRVSPKLSGRWRRGKHWSTHWTAGQWRRRWWCPAMHQMGSSSSGKGPWSI